MFICSNSLTTFAPASGIAYQNIDTGNSIAFLTQANTLGNVVVSLNSTQIYSAVPNSVTTLFFPYYWTVSYTYTTLPLITAECTPLPVSLTSRALPASAQNSPNMSLALGLAVVSIILFTFSFTGINRHEDGFVYMVIFRLTAFLLMFAAYSALILPQQVVYPAYNVIQGNIIMNIQAYNTTQSVPQAVQNIYGWVELAYSVIVLGSIGIDVAFGFGERKPRYA